ncbi:MAG: phosphopentomutase, partial [Ktedonobacterales bacterium]
AATLEELAEPFQGLLFVNLVDCDQLYGHRRNPQGYAQALEQIDAWLPRVFDQLGTRDALFITGDHGTDPTYSGTDHTREAVPILAAGELIHPNVDLNTRASFADLGATLAEAFEVGPLENGTSFAHQIGLG